MRTVGSPAQNTCLELVKAYTEGSIGNGKVAKDMKEKSAGLGN